jgi:hypothetical protein
VYKPSGEFLQKILDPPAGTAAPSHVYVVADIDYDEYGTPIGVVIDGACFNEFIAEQVADETGGKVYKVKLKDT